MLKGKFTQKLYHYLPSYCS